MRKLLPITIIFIGLYFIWSAIGAVIADSNHMGSRINLANDALKSFIESNKESMPEKLVKSISGQVEIIVNEGRLGFSLLSSVALKLFLAGIVLIFAGIKLRVTMPNKSLKQDK